jgi:4a-hydroxytetrahydrobiopterin dehydratase
MKTGNILSLLLMIGLIGNTLFPSPAEAAPPVTRLSASEINEKLQSVTGWKIQHQRLICTYEFANFVQAIAFVNRLLPPAETLAHHPDLEISYNRVKIALTTHDVGGLSRLDFELAQVIANISQIPCQK